MKYLERFFLFLYFKQKKMKQSFYFRGAIKNELFNHKKNETFTSLLIARYVTERLTGEGEERGRGLCVSGVTNCRRIEPAISSCGKKVYPLG